jgi:hypothetical protein
MPTPTYTPLATVTLGSAAATVTFSSIPATYRDLVLVVQATHSAASGGFMRFNSDTTSSYTGVAMAQALTFGVDSFTFSSTSLSINLTYSSDGQTNIVQIMDYSATDKHKTALIRYGRGDVGVVGAGAGRWAKTEAINNLSLISSSGQYSIGSTFNLYGVIA